MGQDSEDCENEFPCDAHGSPPLRTQWTTIGTFAGLHLNYVPSTRRYYINHWRIELGFPIAVLFVIYSSYAVLMLLIVPNVSFIGWKIIFVETVTCIFFGYTYVAAILIGPGYLPFFYPEPISKGDDLSGMVVDAHHVPYAKARPYPRRCRFFKSVGRAVIRPDHLCAWLASFVGKKNHKLFFLFNFWGVIYISVHMCCGFRAVIDLVYVSNTRREIIRYAVICLYLILSFSFFLLTGSFLCQNIVHIQQNRTQFEMMKGFRPTAFRLYPWYRNWEEIFGSIDQWYLWLWPSQAFADVDDYELANIAAGQSNHW
jgi:hypothetical protein